MSLRKFHQLESTDVTQISKVDVDTTKYNYKLLSTSRKYSQAKEKNGDLTTLIPFKFKNVNKEQHAKRYGTKFENNANNVRACVNKEKLIIKASLVQIAFATDVVLIN